MDGIMLIMNKCAHALLTNDWNSLHLSIKSDVYEASSEEFSLRSILCTNYSALTHIFTKVS